MFWSDANDFTGNPPAHERGLQENSKKRPDHHFFIDFQDRL
jgi:hypothetical protein